MTAIKSDVGGSQPATGTPLAPGGTPKSSVQAGIDYLAALIASVSATAALELASQVVALSARLSRAEAASMRAERLARKADDQSALKAQVFN